MGLRFDARQGKILTDATTVDFDQPVTFPAPTTSIPSLNLPHGTAPSAPTDGDVWTTTAGMFVRVNGSTVGPLGTGGGGGDVTKVGTPVDNQIGVWTGDGTIEGDANLTWSGTVLSVTGTIESANASGPTLLNEASSNSNPTLIPNKSDTDSGIGGTGADIVSIIGGGQELFRFVETTSNYNMSLYPLHIVESANSGTVFGSNGILWVRNDTPNVLMFTDDASSDFEVVSDVHRHDGTTFEVYGDQTASLIDALDETFYDNSPTTEGTFSGGTGYAAAEVITLSDGSTITVDAVSGGVVTEFTVETVTTTPFVLGSTLTTTSSTGAGNDDFTLTPDVDNVNLTVSNHYIGNNTNNRIGFEHGDNYAQISFEDSDASSTKATFTFDTNGSGAVSGITVTGAGAGYTGSSFQFNITVASDAGFVPGTEAIITATVLGGKVVSAAVTLAGSGYTINLTGSSVAAADVDTPNLNFNAWFDITSPSTGSHQFIFSDGGYGGGGAIFNLTKQNYYFGGGIDLLEVADHKGSLESGNVQSGAGQIWVKQRSGGGELMFTEGDNDTDYTVQNLIPSTYNFDSSTASADPGAGDFRFDNATPASVTNIYVNDAEHTGRDNAFQLGNLAYGDIIKMRSPYFNRHWIGRVDGTPTDNTGWWTIPVAHIDSSSLFVANNPVQIEIDSLSQTPSVYTALKTSTTSRNTTTTLADDPDLSVTVVEPGYYMVEVCFIWGNVTTTTQGFRFVLVGGTGHGIAHYRTAAVPSASAEFGTLSSTTSVHTNIPSAGTNTPMVGSGFRDITSANTTFKLQWAQGVSNANATELRAGSFIRLTRLGDT